MVNLDDTGAFYWTLDLPAEERPGGRVSAAGKRVVDVLAAAALLVLTSPVLLGAMALVRLTSRGPAIFVQPRIGFGCRRFPMLKLRTMVHGAEGREEELAAARPVQTFLKIPRDPRITPVGRWLRRYSIDELPQLVNVLRGEMSLVGPRPLLLSDFAKYPKRAQMRRFSVKPGLTGLWQVSGRSDLADSERIRLDLEYVDRWSPTLDLEILARTLPAVLSGEGAT